MRIRVGLLRTWWLLPLLSMAGVAASGNDPQLAEAVKRQDKEAIRALLKQHIEVNVAQADGATPLAWAAHWDDLETADLLIRSGADVNVANQYGVTPLFLACTNGSAAMVGTLLNAGANPKSTPPTGETALMRCANTGNLDTVKLLLARGVDVNAKEIVGGQTALMWAVAEKHSDVVRLLISSGADVHVRSKGGFTPLLFAAQQGDADSARILLEAGADVNEAPPPTLSGVKGSEAPMVPLLMAAASGQEAVATFLVEHGADPNATDATGTALHYAVQKGISEVSLTQVGVGVQPPNMITLAKILLAHGANPNVRLTRNPTGLNGAAIDTIVDATPLFLAAVSADLPLTRLLLENGADPLLGTLDRVTPLMAAAGIGHYESRRPADDKDALEVVKLLVEAGSDVNAVSKTDHWTPVHGAAFMGSTRILQYLVDKGAKMDVMDAYGQTPLSISMDVYTKGLTTVAFAKGPNNCPCPEVTTLLIKLGARPLEATGVEALDVLKDSGKAKAATKPDSK